MKVRVLLPCCAGCNSNGRGCHNACRDTAPCQSSSARSRNCHISQLPSTTSPKPMQKPLPLLECDVSFLLPARLVTPERQILSAIKGCASVSQWVVVDVNSHLSLFFWQDSAGGAEESIEKIVNLELVFGYHLKPGNGPKVRWEHYISWFGYESLCRGSSVFWTRKINWHENPLVLESAN